MHEFEHGGCDIGKTAVRAQRQIAADEHQRHEIRRVRRVRRTIRLDHAVGIAVVSGDEQCVAHLLRRRNDLAEASVHALDRLNGG